MNIPMLFYFVRHGETEANARQVLAGAGLDTPLNDQGHAQAKKLAAALKVTINHPLHRIVASHMTRTRQTAEYLALHLKLPIELTPDWREWHLGEWEGQSTPEFIHLLLGEGEPKTGEPRKVFYTRIAEAWRSVHSDTHPYLVVSHGAVWMALQDFLNIPRFKVSNCDLVRVESRDGSWRADIIQL